MRFTANLSGWIKAVGMALTVSAIATIAACGGGGGSSNSSGNSGTPSGPNQQPIAATAANTAPITVGPGVNNVVNIPTVSVTVCVPNTNTCQTINNVQLDTASFGLRLVNSALNSTMQSALPIASATSPTGNLAECTQFADGFTWGTIRNATVQIGGETTTQAVPIQVIGDLASTTVPALCSSTGANESSASALGANGILGVGVSPNDCGATCASVASVTSSNYYSCPSGTTTANCTQANVLTQNQVQNPVAHFATDNNGVIVQMQPISSSGASTATGTVVFGIGTQSNNSVQASATKFLTSEFGDLTNSIFNSRSNVSSFFDSGSNGYFFTDASLTQCNSNFPGFYCPTSTVTEAATVQGASGPSQVVNFNVTSAQTLFNSNNFAFNDLGGTNGSAASLDFGLPFFYGRYMYYGIDQTATGGQAPYVAFQGSFN